MIIITPLFTTEHSVKHLGLAICCSKKVLKMLRFPFAVLINISPFLQQRISNNYFNNDFFLFNTLFTTTILASHSFLANNSFYSCLPLYPFFVSKTENKKGSRESACCNEVSLNSLPANINTFRPSVPEKDGASV